MKIVVFNNSKILHAVLSLCLPNKQEVAPRLLEMRLSHHTHTHSHTHMHMHAYSNNNEQRQKKLQEATNAVVVFIAPATSYYSTHSTPAGAVPSTVSSAERRANSEQPPADCVSRCNLHLSVSKDAALRRLPLIAYAICKLRAPRQRINN